MPLRRFILFTGFALVLALLGVACGDTGHEQQARARLSSILRDSLGDTTHPQVSFIVEDDHPDAHLQVAFDTTTFANLTDSAFGLRARDLARFALRHYEKARALDSVSVVKLAWLRPGVGRMYNWRTFPIAELRAGELK